MSQKDQKWQQLGDRLSGFQATGDPTADFAQFQQLLHQQQNIAKAWWQKPYLWLGLLLVTIVTATALTFLTEEQSSQEMKPATESEALSSILLDRSNKEAVSSSPDNSTNVTTTEEEQNLASTTTSETSQDEIDSHVDSQIARGGTSIGQPVLNTADQTDQARSTDVSTTTNNQTTPANTTVPETLLPRPFGEPSIADESTANTNNTGFVPDPPVNTVVSPAPELVAQRVNQLAGRGLQPLDVEQKLPAPNASGLAAPSLSDKTSKLYLQLHSGLSFHLPSFQKLSFDPGIYAGFSGHYRISEQWELGGQVALSVHSLDILKSDSTPISSIERSVSWSLPNGFVQESNWNADLNHVNMLSLAATARYRLRGSLRVSGGIQFSRLIGVSAWIRERRGDLSELDPYRNLSEYPLRLNNWSLLIGLEYRISPSWSIEAQAAPSFQDITPNEFDAERHTASTLSVGLSYRL